MDRTARDNIIGQTVASLNLRDVAVQQHRARIQALEAAQRYASRSSPSSPLQQPSYPHDSGFTASPMAAKSPASVHERLHSHSKSRSPSASRSRAESRDAILTPRVLADRQQSAAALDDMARECQEHKTALSAATRKLAMLELTLERFVAHFAHTCESGDGVNYYTVTFGLGAIGLILAIEPRRARLQAGVAPGSPLRQLHRRLDDMMDSIDDEAEAYGLTSGDVDVTVAELRCDPYTGVPLQARACGRIAIGDIVVAVNSRLLDRYGPPSLDDVAREFRGAPRPLTVLFRSRGGTVAADLLRHSPTRTMSMSPM